MKRKVIQQGPSTLMVSLPSKWVKENGITKGEEITLEILHNQLVVYSEAVYKQKKASLHIKSKEEYRDRMLMTRYRDGYNEIHIKYDDPATIDDVRDTLRYLLGFEIIEQTGTACTIKNISEGSDEEYANMFRRMFHIVHTMSESCHNYAKTQDIKHLKTAIDLRETLIKLEQFNLRLLNKQNSFSLQQKSLEFFYVWNIATLGKMWSSLAREPLRKNPMLSIKDVTFMKDVATYTQDFYDVYYRRNSAKLLRMKKRLYSLRPIGEKLLNTSKNKLIIFYLMRLMNRIYEITLSFDF
jgi:phosphate uptake regulator